MSGCQPRRADANQLPIGGIEAFTTIDFPGHLAAVVFCQGCPWRCPYCHNPALQAFRREGWISWAEVEALLRERLGFLDGVVFSGGEPTAHAALLPAVRALRSLGYRIGLHTAGIYPKRLEQVVPLVHWIGLDVKAPFGDTYDLLTGQPGSSLSVQRSLQIVLHSQVALQIRTTVDPTFLSPHTLTTLQNQLAALGAPPPILQQMRPPA